MVCACGGFSPLVWKILQVLVCCVSTKHLSLPVSAQPSTARSHLLEFAPTEPENNCFDESEARMFLLTHCIPSTMSKKA